MLKHSIITIILIIASLNLNGQNSGESKKFKNSISFDCSSLKFVGMFSFNYERTIIYSPHYKMLTNIGIGGWYLTTLSKWYYGPSVPLSLNSLIGSGNSHFEADFGIRYSSFIKRSDKDKFAFFPIFNLGYRYQRNDSKRLTFRSFIGLSGIGIGVGKQF